MKLDVLAIGAHPDDVELSCGGCVALLARQGRRVGILHLTSGERGTRGTPEERRAEAKAAAIKFTKRKRIDDRRAAFQRRVLCGAQRHRAAQQRQCDDQEPQRAKHRR